MSVFKIGVATSLFVLIVGYFDYRVQGPDIDDPYNDGHAIVASSPKGMDFYHVFLTSTALRASLVNALRAPFGERPPIVANSAYPPAFLVAAMPFTFLTDNHAYQAYCLVLLAFLCAAVYASLSEKSGTDAPGGLSREHKLLLTMVITALLFQTYPVSFAFERGNSDIVATAFAAFGLVAIRRHSARVAAACVAISTNIKLYPAILVVLLFLRFRWKGVLWFMVFTIGQLLIIGPSGLLDFLSIISRMSNEPYLWPGNHSLYSFVAELSKEGLSGPSFRVVYNGCLLGLGAAVVAGAFRTQWEGSGAFSGAEVGVCGMCFSLMSLVPTTSHDYQLVAQVVPITLLLSRSWRELFTSKASAAVATAIISAAVAYLFIPRLTVLPLRLAGVTSPATVMKTPALLVEFVGFACVALFGVRRAGNGAGFRRTPA